MERERKQKLLKWFYAYKEKQKCLLCCENESVCLEFHHWNPINKRFAIGTAISKNYSIKSIKREIEENCIVLCSNCHKRLHAHKLTEKEKNKIKEYIFEHFYKDMI